MKGLDAFNYDEDEKVSTKSLFDLINAEDETENQDYESIHSKPAIGLNRMDLFGDVEDESKEDTKVKEEHRKTVGSFDEDLFKPTENDTDVIPRTVLTSQVDYNEIKNKIDKEREARKKQWEEEHTRSLELELELPKEIEQKKPPRRVRKVSTKIDGIATNHISVDRNLNNNLMIKSNPNEIIIPNLTDIRIIENNKIIGSLGNDFMTLTLLGFTTKFEAVFKLESNTSILTGGSSKIIKNGLNTFLLNEVYIFELGDSVTFKINDNLYETSFKELNKRNTSIKALPYFEVGNVRIKQIRA